MYSINYKYIYKCIEKKGKEKKTFNLFRALFINTLYYIFRLFEIMYE